MRHHDDRHDEAGSVGWGGAGIGKVNVSISMHVHLKDCGKLASGPSVYDLAGIACPHGSIR